MANQAEDSVLQKIVDHTLRAIREGVQTEVIGAAEEFGSTPIERVFLAAFAAIHQSWLGQSPHGGVPYLFFADPKFTPDDIESYHARYEQDYHLVDLVVPQFVIGRYRADFMVRRTIGHPFQPRIQTSPIIVECDGHAFHERTKEQARHDKARDRFMQASGFQVYRFTGSELWQEPWRCAGEINDVLDGQLAMMSRARNAARRAQGGAA